MHLGMDLREVADRFELRLKGDLPGKDAHRKLAPSDRIHGRYPSEPNDKTSDGAVLILLYPKNTRIHTILIQRPDYPGAHSNQISFPGGKSEAGDKSILETAIRESEEEVGVTGKKIRLCGTLSPLFIPVSNILVKPVVGFSFTESTFTPDLNEVSFIIEAGLDELTDPSIIRQKKMEILGQDILIPFYDLRGFHIWGATAMIISEFLELYNKVIT